MLKNALLVTASSLSELVEFNSYMRRARLQHTRSP